MCSGSANHKTSHLYYFIQLQDLPTTFEKVADAGTRKPFQPLRALQGETETFSCFSANLGSQVGSNAGASGAVPGRKWETQGCMDFSQPMLHFKTDHIRHNQYVGTDLNAFHCISAFWISCPSNVSFMSFG